MTPLAWAHGVYVYAWADGDMVRTESYFGGKRKVINGLVQVFDLKDNKLLEGRTNDQGEFSFKSPGNLDLRIVVEAGLGHRNEFVLKAEGEGAGMREESVAVEVPMARTDSQPVLPAMGPDELTQIVERALDARLGPIREELAAIRNERGPGLTEIIGGIGYIFGIMGLILYLKTGKAR